MPFSAKTEEIGGARPIQNWRQFAGFFLTVFFGLLPFAIRKEVMSMAKKRKAAKKKGAKKAKKAAKKRKKKAAK